MPRWVLPGLGILVAIPFIGLVFAAQLAVVFGYKSFVISSGSMKPTLLIGDQILAQRIFAEAPVTRGDVFVYRVPNRGEAPFIGRLIGMPGDVLSMTGGEVVLNGTPLVQVQRANFTEPYEQQGPFDLWPRCTDPQTPQVGEPCHKAMFEEQIANRPAHAVLNIGDGPLDNVEPIEVPPGHYAFMGDNRDNSIDSRIPVSSGVVGMVPRTDILARVDRILLSSGGVVKVDVSKWRHERMWMKVE